MRRIISQIFIVLLLAVVIFAQSETDKPKLIDRFSDLPIGEIFGRLDSLGAELLKDKKSSALIKIYGSTASKKHFVFPYTWGVMMKSYLVGSRSFEAKRISVQNCDLDKDYIYVELFLVSQNYNSPKCDDELPVIRETVLFTSEHYENPYIFFDNPYYIPGAEEARLKITSEIIAKLLDRSSEGKIYLIGYLGTNLHGGSKQNSKGEWKNIEIRKLDKPSQMKKMFREVEQRLVKSGVNASRIVKVDGGYQDSTRKVEIWFVPKDDKVPKLEPDYFPKKRRK